MLRFLLLPFLFVFLFLSGIIGQIDGHLTTVGHAIDDICGPGS